ncbi:MAG: hypothetical protein GY804_01010 [Alphaproteobacteria bacterium]|nr:hypothetical protein [Alphaproteobacteria bacterium]
MKLLTKTVVRNSLILEEDELIWLRELIEGTFDVNKKREGNFDPKLKTLEDAQMRDRFWHILSNPIPEHY